MNDAIAFQTKASGKPGDFYAETPAGRLLATISPRVEQSGRVSSRFLNVCFVSGLVAVADGMEHANELIDAFLRTYAAFVAAARAKLIEAGPDTCLPDGMGGYFFMDGASLVFCHAKESREESSCDLDESAWDATAGYFEGYSIADASRCLAGPVGQLSAFPA